MSPRHSVPASQKIGLLRFLAVDNLEVAAAADEMQMSYDAAFDVARHHGYPDVPRMMWAIERLQDVTDGSMDGETPEPFDLANITAPKTAKVSGSDVLLARAAKSHHKRTQGLGQKIASLLDDLTAKLDGEDEARKAEQAERAAKAETDRKIAELEAQIAALRGADAPTPRTIRSAPRLARGEYPCEPCGKVFDTVQGVNMHRRRAHGLSALKAAEAVAS